MKVSNIKFTLIILVILISIRFYSLLLIPDRVSDYLELIVLIIIFLGTIVAKKRKFSVRKFSPYITGIIFTTLLSAIPALIFHGQSLPVSILASRVVFFYLIYYLLHSFNVNVIILQKIILAIGLGWIIAMIAQQIIYPKVIFSIRTDASSKVIDIDYASRGVRRFFISGMRYGILFFFYIWIQLQSKPSFRNWTLFSVAMLAIILTGTRQIIFVLLLIIIIDYLKKLYILNANKVIFLITLLIIISLSSGYWLPYINKLLIFSESQEIISTDYIRIQAINYYMYEYWPHWTCYLWGNGWEHSYSSYGNEIIQNIEGRLRYFRSDIGLIGAFNKFGIFYILYALAIYGKIIFGFRKNSFPIYLKYLFIYLLITSLTGSNFFEKSESIVMFSILFYIIDKYNFTFRQIQN